MISLTKLVSVAVETMPVLAVSLYSVADDAWYPVTTEEEGVLLIIKNGEYCLRPSSVQQKGRCDHKPLTRLYQAESMSRSSFSLMVLSCSIDFYIKKKITGYTHMLRPHVIPLVSRFLFLSPVGGTSTVVSLHSQQLHRVFCRQTLQLSIHKPIKQW